MTARVGERSELRRDGRASAAGGMMLAGIIAVVVEVELARLADFTGFLALMRRHRVELGLAFRVTAAALTALALAQYLDVTLPLWAVLTAVIVTQLSVGRSLKAALDYLIGTVGGAIYGGALGVLVPHASEPALLAVLGLAVAPLALLAAKIPRLNTAPITAIIVVLLPTMTHASALASAIDRVIEVTLGAVVGLAISFVLLPSNAYAQAIAAASRVLDRLAAALETLLAGLTQGLDADALHRIQDGIGHDLAQLNLIGAEAERERSARLVKSPDTGPLLRTLLRLRHDLVMIGRAAAQPLPEVLGTRLQGVLTEVATAAAGYLHASGVTLRLRLGPPPFVAVEQALEHYAQEVARLRQEGLTRGLPADQIEHFFAIGFVLEQVRRNFGDLERCVAEWAMSLQRRDFAKAPVE
jgi:hypothetical protein